MGRASEGVVVTRDDAIRRAGQAMALARAERDQLAAQGGPEAVADAAWRPGGPSKEEIARLYAGLMDEERAKRDAAQLHAGAHRGNAPSRGGLRHGEGR